MRQRLVIAFVVILCLIGPANAVPPDRARQWRDDLLFLQQEAPKVHADLFHSISREQWDASVAALVEKVPSITDPQIIVELAAIMASIGDGHTRLTLPVDERSGFFSGHATTPMPGSSDMVFHYLPIRLFVFDDGLFVHEIDRRHEGLLGARVVKIGDVSADEAMARVTRTVQHDNEQQVRGLLPSRLEIPEVLEALGICPDASRVTFELAAGKSTKKLVLAPVANDVAVDWVNFDSKAREHPLYLRHPEHKFWFEYLKDRSLVYCQYNEVYDEDNETVAAFSSRLTDFITANDVKTLALDLRFNRGGNNGLNRSFLRALIACPALQEPGSLYVIVGRETFSAAMMFALDIEKLTNAIFVGEPTGARPNHYGDSRKITLPNSGLTVRISTLYWQYGGPKDDRKWLAPHIPVAFTSADDRANQDPVMQKILEVTSAPAGRSPAGKWVGRALGYDVTISLHDTDGAWDATLDIPSAEAMGLPLANVRYTAPALSLDFPNGDEIISFSGAIHGDTIIGRVLMDGQILPWVMTPAP